MRIIAPAIGLFLLVPLQHLCAAERGAKINWSNATQSYEFDIQQGRCLAVSIPIPGITALPDSCSVNAELMQ
jgi:hypothetical protein